MEVEEIKELVNIREYIEQFVDAENVGGKRFCICPFHDEKTPSFFIDEAHQHYHCFGCGAHGDVIDFIQRYHKVSYPTALQMVCLEAGISEADLKHDISPHLSATKILKKFKNDSKKLSEQKKATIEVPQDFIDRIPFEINKLSLWTEEGIKEEQLRKYGVRFDSLSNRIIYPVRDPSGVIINISGRTVDPNWKEKKLRKYSYYYSTGCIDTVYGVYENLNSIKQKKQIILFEGMKSVLKAESFGYSNCGALLTSKLSRKQLEILLSLKASVVFALDGEVDILSDKNILLLKKFVPCYWVRSLHSELTPKESPVDGGCEIWNKLFSSKTKI